MYSEEIVLQDRRVRGYRIFIDKRHPLSNSCNYVYYHRHVASLKEGRWIDKSEHVHHIDGNKENNKENNLLVLTNKEHALLHNPQREKIKCYICGENFIPSKKQKYCSARCGDKARRKIERPTREELIKEIEESNFVQVGKRYGVSDNAIRKWLKSVP